MDHPSQPLLDCAVFTCTDLRVDLDSGEVALGYRLSGGSTPAIEFTERLRFPVPERQPDERRRQAFHAVLRLLHAVAGVSYFKAAAPPVVDLGTVEFTAAERAYLHGVYRHGLREFAYTNDLPAVLATGFTGDAEPPRPETPADGSWFSIEDRPLVPCGGGKDSIVSTEAMIASGRDPIAFAVNPNHIITGVVAAAGLELLAVRRTLDRRLFELNRQGAYNGHVPVTAVNSLLAVATAILHGLGPVVMSNESSASAPNLDWNGEPVNHQWSKSGEAERLLQAALASRLGADGMYFSLLRHLNEMQIARLYAATTGYDGVLTSCNNAYTIDRPATVRWCGDCPKCRFVFLALAPFASRERMVGIFGADLLADESQLPGFRVLLGIGGYKPFECVGELSESQAAVARLAELPQWRESVIVRGLLPDLDAGAAPSWAEVLDRQAVSYAPKEFVAALDSLAALRDPAGTDGTPVSR